MSSVLRPLLFVLVLLSLAGAAPARAGSASLVADIGTFVPDSVPPSDGPHDLLAVGGRVLFTASEPSSGAELWVSDGTPQGTELLRDFCPGTCSETFRILGVAGGTAFVLFRGEELWRTDGTRSGTFLLLGPPRAEATPAFTFLGGRLFFTACDEDNGCELWVSDGTPGGTRLAVELVAGQGGGDPLPRAVIGGQIYFIAFTPAMGLWRSDGTPAGTVMLRQLPAYYVPGLYTAAGDTFYFVVDGADQELWASDGTPAGTRPVTDFAATRPFEGTSVLEPAGGAVYFEADDVTGGNDLWRSDGTPQGTRRATAFGYAAPLDFRFGRDSLEPIGSRVLFIATDGLSEHRLWTTGGTPQTTQPLAGCPGGCPAVTVETRLLRLGDRVLFFAGDPDRGRELWASDGTGPGTRKVRDLCAGGCGPDPEFVDTAGGKLYFITYTFDEQNRSQLWQSDGTTAGTQVLLRLGGLPVGYADELETVAAGGKVFFGAHDPAHGTQLWASDGTAGGTEVASALTTGAPSSQPTALAGFGGGVLFEACEGGGGRHFRSDGTAAGTFVLVDTDRSCGRDPRFPEPVVVGGLAFFLRSSPAQLWRTDGTVAGTVQLTAFADARVETLAAHQGRILFGVSSPGGVSIWESDGTAAGTAKLVDLPSAVAGLSHLTSTGSDFYFAAHQASAVDAWRSDGTPAGTRQVTDLDHPYAFSDPPQFTRLGGSVYFLSSGDHISGSELWRTNGTAEGTTLVVPRVLHVQQAQVARELVAFGGALYFFGRLADFDADLGLWRSDGTTAGTVLLKVIEPQRLFNQEVAWFTVVGGQLLFVADDGVHGVELWRTDGTAAGTTMVEDVLPGTRSSVPLWLTAAGGRLFFTATDGEHGIELWESDGTAAGTRMVQDLAPGGLSSHPGELTASGQRLFFRADDGVWGEELWVLPLDGPSCQPSATALCLAGGRYKVEAHWRDFAGNSGVGQAVALTADTGYFWFFDAANVEVILKVLDGQGVNGHTWVFYGALSSVEYTLTVTDTATGAARRYVNPSGRLGSVADTLAFGPRGATPSALSFGPEAVATSAVIAESRSLAAAAVPCVPSSTRLCLNGGRFAVEASWTIPGDSGAGTAVPLTGDTGYFWFFGSSNVEIVLKVLDGRPLNGKFWVFYGALSDVGYTLTVTDTQTGTVKVYKNPQGRLASVADTGAF